MATHQIPMLGENLNYDNSGDVFPSILDIELSLTNAKLQSCIVMQFPTGTDPAIEGKFVVPQNYAGTPVAVIKCILDGTPANILAFGLQQVSVDDSETVDVAYEAEDLVSNSTWTGYAVEEQIELTITITPAAAYLPSDEVYWRLFRDDSVDTTSYNILLTSLMFQYSDT